ncbi:MAG TPA: hypothetical protein VES20_02050 [Bryobacteraceae bacterium]|nr:hypothetical protein [Bryobacteraceae bacterium]
MSKRALSVIAIILIALMGVIAMAGLDNLQPGVRQRAQTAASQLASARSEAAVARTALQRTFAAEPALFRAVQAPWQDRLQRAEARLRTAETEAQKLRQLVEENDRDSQAAVTTATERVEAERTAAMNEIKAVRADADRWLDFKRRAPEMLREMEGRYTSVTAFDPQTATAAARKAAAEWTAKKSDIENRIAALESTKARAQQLWAATAADRAEAAAADWDSVDFAALANAEQALRTAAADMPRTAESINKLASQLYLGRDKVLLDLDRDEGVRQHVRVVETTYADASLSNPKIQNSERWEPLTEARFRQLEKAVGMVVERKPAGKYDSETELTAQAPGYAYIAPPGQANQYGSWNNGVWSWLPQYLILSQLLRGPSYPPIRYDDYNDYNRHRSRGGVWYGRDNRYGRTWGGGGRTSGGWGSVLDRYTGRSSSSPGAEASSRPRERWTWGGNSRSYGNSQYRSRGTFGGSRYGSGSRGSGFGSRSYSRGGGRRR